VLHDGRHNEQYEWRRAYQGVKMHRLVLMIIVLVIICTISSPTTVCGFAAKRKVTSQKKHRIKKKKVHSLESLLELENELHEKGYTYVIGSDDSGGAGCIAGPVVVASCCILQPYYDTFLSTSSSSTTQSKSEVLVSQSEMAIPSKDGCKQTSVQPEVQVSQSEMDILSKVNDCKQLTATQRQDIYETIQSHPEIFAISISQRTPEEIDEVNINRAQMLAFAESIETLVEQHELPFDSAYSIVDGQKSPKLYASQRIQSNDGEEGLKVFKCRPYVNADANVYCVALASIIARVVRDEAMQKLDEQYPLYRFSQHSGFGNKEHIEILHKLGAIEGVHRMSFKQVKGR